LVPVLSAAVYAGAFRLGSRTALSLSEEGLLLGDLTAEAEEISMANARVSGRVRANVGGFSESFSTESSSSVSFRGAVNADGLACRIGDCGILSVRGGDCTDRVVRAALRQDTGHRPAIPRLSRWTMVFASGLTRARICSAETAFVKRLIARRAWKMLSRIGSSSDTELHPIRSSSSWTQPRVERTAELITQLERLLTQPSVAVQRQGRQPRPNE